VENETKNKILRGRRFSLGSAHRGGGGAAPNRSLMRVEAEIQLLCDGRNSALDIKKMLDTQFRQETSLEAILSHLDVLKKAGLVAF